MIVRNEAAIIERVLSSVQGYVSCCVICDTGSTDNTVERIHALCERFGMACEVHQFPFINFSQARNEALERARRSPLAFDYLLLCDADMALQVDDVHAFQRLQADALSMKQENQNLAYQNLRLLRRGADARYVGATHEALVVNGSTGTVQGAWFVDHADGGTRSEKLERDERLLKASLATQPDDSRAMFYLAQTLFDTGRVAEAATWYQKRWEAGGWAEERWYALYKRASCLQQLGDEARFISFSLQAYNERPHRAEPLVSVAKHLAATGQHDAALLYLEQAQRLRLPTDDVLFIEKDAYGVAISELVSISGFYSQQPERRLAGQTLCEQLSIDPLASPQRRHLARTNLSYYAPPLGQLCDSFAPQRLDFPAPEGFVLTNPSVAREASGYRCVVRAVNYQLEAGRYHIQDPQNVVRTRNFMLTLDGQFNLTSVKEIQDHSSLPRWENNPIRGFEDCRLFSWQGRWWCSATARDVSANGFATMVLLELDEANDVRQAFMLRGYGDHLHQKNWMPVAGERLQFIYSCGPSFVLDASRADGSFVVEHGADPGIACEHWRGGAAVPWPGGFLALIHEAIEIGTERSYLHRFVQLTHEGIPQSASVAFHLLHRGIEFVAGLSYGLSNAELVISFGVRDQEAWLGKLPTAAVQALLRPLPRPQPSPFPGYTPTP